MSNQTTQKTDPRFIEDHNINRFLNLKNDDGNPVSLKCLRHRYTHRIEGVSYTESGLT